MASTHNDFFQGQTDRGLFYRPHYSWETWLSEIVERKRFFSLEGVKNDLLTRFGTNLRLPINFLFSSDNWTGVKQLFLKVPSFVTARQQCPVNTLVCTETHFIFFFVSYKENEVCDCNSQIGPIR